MRGCSVVSTYFGSERRLPKSNGTATSNELSRKTCLLRSGALAARNTSADSSIENDAPPSPVVVGTTSPSPVQVFGASSLSMELVLERAKNDEKGRHFVVRNRTFHRAF